MGNFYLGVCHPANVTKLFTDEGEAIEWLKGYREGAVEDLP